MPQSTDRVAFMRELWEELESNPYERGTSKPSCLGLIRPVADPADDAWHRFTADKEREATMPHFSHPLAQSTDDALSQKPHFRHKLWTMLATHLLTLPMAAGIRIQDANS